MSQPTVILLGRLGKDPELKVIGDGLQIAKFSVATDNKFVKGEDKGTIWFDVDVWGKRSDWAMKHLNKGASVQVIGSLSSREWEGKTYLSVSSFDVQFAGAKASVDNQVGFADLESPAALTADVVNHAPQAAAPPALDTESPF